MVLTRGKKEVAYVFFLFMFSKVFAYFTLLVFANLYNQEVYGQASFIFAIFHLVVLFTCMGMPDTLVPWLIKKRDTSSVFYFFLGLNLIVMIVSFVLITQLRYQWALPFVLLLPFMLLDYFARAIVKSHYRYDLAQWTSTLYVALTLIFAFLFRRWEQLGIALAYSIAYFIPIIFLVWNARIGLKNVLSRLSIRIQALAQYLKQGSATMLITTSFALLTWIDSSILGFLAPFTSVAQYNVAGAIANVVAAIPLSVMHFILTRSAEVRDVMKARSILQRGTRLSYVLSMMFGILINALIFVIMKIFFPQYQGIEIFVAILSIGVSFYAVYSLFTTYMIGRMEQYKTVMPMVLAAGLNVVLDILLVPRFGLYGITVATLFAHAVALMLLTTRLKMYRFFWVLLLSPLLLLITYALQWWGLLMVPLSVFVFFLTGLITREDIAIVLQVAQRIAQRKA